MAIVTIPQTELPFVETKNSTLEVPEYEKTVRFRYRVVNNNRNIQSDWSVVNFAKQDVLLEQIDDGLPRGGNIGDVPVKNGPGDYDVGWKPIETVITENNLVTYGSNNLLPAGGFTDQVLTKRSDASYDVEWDDVQALPVGGATGQALIKQSGVNYDATWGDVSASPQDANLAIGISMFA